MQILLAPTVKVIGYSKFIENEEFPIPDDGEDAIKIGSAAAKVCYRSSGKNGRANIENARAVIESYHGSVLQHSSLSLYIDGISRACSLELNRHDIEISQASTRYTNEEDSAIVLEPYYAALFQKYNPEFQNESWKIENVSYFEETEATTEGMEKNLLLAFINDCQYSIDSYTSQVAILMKLNPQQLEKFELRKYCRGKARNVLCHALNTSGVWTANHRMFRVLLELRSERHAESEIRRLAIAIYEAIKPFAPTYYEDYSEGQLFEGYHELVPKYRKI